MSAKIELKELEKDNLIDIILHKEKEIEKLKKEKEKLEKELKKYKNAHTPSSKLRFDKPQAKGLPVGRKKVKK